MHSGRLHHCHLLVEAALHGCGALTGPTAPPQFIQITPMAVAKLSLGGWVSLLVALCFSLTVLSCYAAFCALLKGGAAAAAAAGAGGASWQELGAGGEAHVVAAVIIPSHGGAQGAGKGGKGRGA